MSNTAIIIFRKSLLCTSLSFLLFWTGLLLNISFFHTTQCPTLLQILLPPSIVYKNTSMKKPIYQNLKFERSCVIYGYNLSHKTKCHKDIHDTFELKRSFFPISEPTSSLGVLQLERYQRTHLQRFPGPTFNYSSISNGTIYKVPYVYRCA